MFNSISGRLSEKRADSICIDTGGVEWELAVPARSVDDFGALEGEAKAYAWLHHYEDGMRLFGFPSREERTVFLELMKVEGIGPKQALRVLSGIRPEALDAALEVDDLAALQRIPGVGPKLAQKMLLALKGKLVLRPAEGGASSGAAAGEWADLVRAFADMGFERKRVERAVKELAPQVPAGPERERELFRRVLLELSAGA
ncbi:MAG TPA: Holliday junction branch migration protein RuvA [Spirochaetales bacterium]|nr:Holliday junction branch migration protein RuvA [Spirochaetales bacterium]HRY55040.1 Holliday junction branch migration protein RuvA [Spirochaetia bacterium]HRZ64363.1 Holliday junction branch migration protein RuvA [Spirochaetia bacterium]